MWGERRDGKGVMQLHNNELYLFPHSPAQRKPRFCILVENGPGQLNRGINGKGDDERMINS